MDPELVFTKSAKGREEIEKRIYRIEARRRVMLILVDGQSTVGDLASRSANSEEALGILQSLWTEGFIESGSSIAAVPPVSASESLPVSAAVASGRTLAELQSAASRSISNLLGPDGESMALRLEKTKTIEQFIADAQKTREALKDYVGARKADAFWQALGL